MKYAKKAVIAYVLIVILTMGLIAGCAADTQSEDTAAAGNAAPDADGNVRFEIPERGLVFKISQEYLDKGVDVTGYNENINGFINASLHYYAPSSDAYFDELAELYRSEDATSEELQACMEKIWDVSRELMEIVLVKTDEFEELTESGKALDDFTIYGSAELLGENDGYTYIISIPDLDYGALNEDEIAEYLDCKAYMQTVKENLEFTKVELEVTDTQLDEAMPEFTSKDINGNTVDNSIFAGKTLTVVNVWGTFCSPCIDEMPELAEWAENMPEGVQLIGLVGDIEGESDTEHLELAQKIADKAGVEFVNIIANDDLSGLMKGIIGFPTTFFVDGGGNIVGEPVVGADVQAYKDFVEEYIK